MAADFVAEVHHGRLAKAALAGVNGQAAVVEAGQNLQRMGHIKLTTKQVTCNKTSVSNKNTNLKIVFLYPTSYTENAHSILGYYTLTHYTFKLN